MDESSSSRLPQLSYDEFERTLRVTGLPEEADDDDIYAMFESERIGGGTVEQIHRSNVASAFITFHDDAVVERLLKKAAAKPVRMLGQTLTLERCSISESCSVIPGRCIVVSGVTRDTDVEEELVPLLENKRKSGGPVDKAERLSEDCVLITFVDQSTAQHWVNVGQLKFGASSFVLSWPTTEQLDLSENSEEIDARVIYVADVTEELSDSVLLSLENKRRGGGPTDYTELVDDGILMAKFADVEVAQHFTEQGFIEVLNKRLSVSNTPRKSPRKITPVTTDDVSVMSTTVEISGISVTTSEDYLRMYFESEKRSGGGELNHLQYSQAEGTATITFHDHTAVKRVQQREHVVNSAELSVRVLESLTEDLRDQECAVRVSNIASLTRDFIECYFESERHSGGGTIEDTFFTQSTGVAVITFSSPHVAERVSKRSSHQLNSVQLTVERLASCPPPPAILADVDEEKLLFSGLPVTQHHQQTRGNDDAAAADGDDDDDGSGDDEQKLKNFVQRATGAQIRHVTYSTQRDSAVVTFLTTPDYKSLRQLVVSKPFQGRMISVQKVAHTSSVIVHGVMRVNEEMISLHFENERRSGGGEVKAVTKHNDFAVVTFKNRNVIPRVVGQRQVIDKDEAKVDLFYPYLSHIATASSCRPPVIIPHDVVISLDKAKSKFIRHSDKFRAELQSQLAASQCHVQWPDDVNGGKLTLHCTLTERDADAAQQVLNWTDKCQSAVDSHLANIASVDERVSGEIWTKFVQETKSAAQSALTELYLEEDDKSFCLSCVGVSDAVALFHDAAVAVNKKLMEELATAQSKKFEIIPNLTTAQLQIIKTSRFWEAMSTSVEVTFDGHGMSLQGCETEIMAVKVGMYEKIVSQIQTKTFPVDQFKLKLLRKPDMMQYFQSIFEQKKLNVACSVTADNLVVHGLDASSISETSATLDRELCQSKVPLDSASSAALNLPEWKSIETTLSNDCKFVDVAVAADKTAVTCCGIRDQVEAAEANIKKFFEQNTILEQFVKLPEGKVTYIRRQLMTEVENIIKSLQTDAVKLEPIEDGDKSGFVVRATRHGLEQVTLQVVELSKDILEVVHDSDLPGTQKYFATKRGKDSLTALESRSKVVVLLSEEPLSHEGNDGTANRTVAVPVVKSEVCVSVSKTMIRVVKGCVTECRAEALIVTIADNLKHTDGAAKLLAAAGGKDIEDECDAIVKSGSKPLAAEALLMKPGKLESCSHVIYAVVKPWQGGHQKEEDFLFTSVSNSLNIAAERKLRAVAIAGVDWGFPANVACQIVLDAVAEFQTTSQHHFTDILLIDNRDQIVNHFHENLGRQFGKQHVKIVSGQPAEIPMANVTSASSLPASQQQAASRYVKTSNSAVLQTPEGVAVTLVKGAIADQQVDVIVNTVAQDLDLSQGAVSSSLLAVAGPGIQQECRTQVPAGQRLGVGTIIRTSGHQLRCKDVLHGPCIKWDAGAGNCEQTMRRLINSCLQKAHDSSMTSIAIPAIGTGNLRVPGDIACWVMYDEVDKFSQNNATTSLKDIRFVVYDKDPPTIAAFDRFLQTLAGPASQAKPAPASGRQRRVKPTFNSDSAASSSSSSAAAAAAAGASTSVWQSAVSSGKKKDKKATVKTKANKKSSVPGDAVNLRKKRIKIGNLTMEVVQGDITEERTDVIVNSTNKNLNLVGGEVAKAIVRKGGKTIEEECKRIGEATDNIAVTSAGNLPCRCIIHLASPPAYEKKAPTPQDWEERVIKCLKKTESMRMKSIAFPLLGTGKWTTPAAEMAESILNAVGEFSINEKPTHLRLVRITIFQLSMVDDFAQAVAKKIAEKNARGFLGKIKDWWSGAGDMKLVDCDDNDYNDDDSYVLDEAAERRYKVVFHLFGSTQSDIDQVIREIDELGKEAVSDRVLDSVDDQAHIAKLTRDQIIHLQTVASRHQIKLNVEQGKRLNRMRLQGDSEDVATVMSAVYKCFQQVDLTEHKKAEAQLIAQQAHWEYQNADGSFDSYPPDINAIIEKAFQAKNSSAEWQEDNDELFIIDFSQNLESTKSSGQQISVKRICDAPIPQPKNWAAMPAGKQLLIVDIPMGSKEFEEVERNAKIAPRNTIKEILKIERIQNPNLYQQYAVRRMHMDAANGPNAVNEQLLWHGTSAETVQHINNDGFNRSYCGKNAVVYGQGVYFAKEWWYSAADQYSPPDGQRQKRVYQARVLTGQYTLGNQDYIDAPFKPNSQVLRYDSVVNNDQNPMIFVIFRDSQAYPEYLITFI